MKKTWIMLTSVVVFCLTLAILVAFLVNRYDDYKAHMYLIPDGYVGWVEVEYDQPGYPELKQEKNALVYEIPPSGKLITASPNASGPVTYYYVLADGTRKSIPFGENAMVHHFGTSSSSTHNDDGTTIHTPQTVKFFVGTTEQLDEAQRSKP